MTKRKRLDRLVTSDEVRVIRTTLEVAPASPDAGITTVPLEQLHAVSACTCGCESIDFDGADDAEKSKPIANAVAQTRRGGTVGVIVWGTTSRVTGLEIFDLGAGQDDLKLPVPSTIRALKSES